MSSQEHAKIDPRRKIKTFGMRTPTDLHYKLLFDIERLRKATSQMEARYAAFDCAVDAWHLVDWTLHHEAISDETHKRLSGRKRRAPSTGDTRLSIEASFAELQAKRLPNLQFCHMLQTA